ncbi:hypothetical protein LCL95_02260 [Bacillus timonensis]|nr:hypothetical protein [Bacillus timonensis]
MLQRPQSAIVESTLQHLFHRNSRSDLPNVEVLTYLTYHMAGMDEAFNSIKELRRQQTRVRLLIDPILLDYFSKNEIVRFTEVDDLIVSNRELEEKKHHFHSIYLPILSFSLLSNILQVKDRLPIVRLILWALLSGKSVIAHADGIDPSSNMLRQNSLDRGNLSLKQALNQKLKQVQSFGIQMVDRQMVASTFKELNISKKLQVITAEQVEKLVKINVKQLDVTTSTIITPLAKDLINQYHIELVYMEKEKR